MISLIVAVADNGVIGVRNCLPWRLPVDLARFKQLTMGKPMIMGRKTFDSLGRVLPGRPHIVVTRQKDLQLPANCYVVTSFDDALESARTLVDAGGEIMVIGGAEVFKDALPKADRIYLTQVHLSPEGDVFFEPLNGAEWNAVERIPVEGDPACTFVTYDRVPPKHG